METVKVTNRARRWVCVRIGNGRTLRLGPQETSAELPAHCARAPELRALCAKGVLTVFDPAHGESHDSAREGIATSNSADKEDA